MFRALEHDGVAGECLFDLFAAGRKVTGEQHIKARAACGVIAVSLACMRRMVTA